VTHVRQRFFESFHLNLIKNRFRKVGGAEISIKEREEKKERGERLA